MALDIYSSPNHRAVRKETGQTNPIERLNNTPSQRISRLVRESLSFSKKMENHVSSVWYFIHDYNAQEEATILHRPLACQLWQNIAQAFQVFDRLSFSSESDREQRQRILLKRFQLFDSDGSRQISLEKLKACIAAIKPGLTDEEIELRSSD